MLVIKNKIFLYLTGGTVGMLIENPPIYQKIKKKIDVKRFFGAKGIDYHIRKGVYGYKVTI